MGLILFIHISYFIFNRAIVKECTPCNINMKTIDLKKFVKKGGAVSLPIVKPKNEIYIRQNIPMIVKGKQFNKK